MDTDHPEEKLKQTIAFFGDTYGIDLVDVLTFMEQRRSTEATSATHATPQTPAPVATTAAPHADPGIAVAGETIAIQVTVNPEAVAFTSPIVDGANERVTVSAAEEPAVEKPAANDDTPHIPAPSPTPTGNPPSTNGDPSASEARERALRYIAMAKRVGSHVQLYKHLQDLIMAWIYRQAWEVMPSEELEKTWTVRGMLHQINHILNPGLRTIQIPQTLVDIWAEALEVRYEVADEYLQEQTLHPHPELEAANGRHEFYRKYFQTCLHKVNEYRNS